MTAITTPPAVRGMTPATYRYGGVLAVAMALLVFEVLAPAADWVRAVVAALEAIALIIVVATSRVRGSTRRGRALVVGGVSLAVVAAIGSGALSVAVASLIIGILAACIPASLAAGLVRLVREHGATPQAVAGGLAIYLFVGLVFAWLIGFVAAVDDSAYFVSGGDGTPGQRVYFSFTVLTTTGFGDFAAATALGQALAVVEMLAGQLYLVTVLGILVGRVVGSASRVEAAGVPRDMAPSQQRGEG